MCNYVINCLISQMDIVKEVCYLDQTQQLVHSFLKGTSSILGVRKPGSCHPLMKFSCSQGPNLSDFNTYLLLKDFYAVKS